MGSPFALAQIPPCLELYPDAEPSLVCQQTNTSGSGSRVRFSGPFSPGQGYRPRQGGSPWGSREGGLKASVEIWQGLGEQGGGKVRSWHNDEFTLVPTEALQRELSPQGEWAAQGRGCLEQSNAKQCLLEGIT